MSEHSPPPPKRFRSASGDLMQLSKEELVKKLQKQQEYIDQLEAKTNTGEDTDDKDKNPVSESSRRENILVMRLANKEQEVQDYAAQISHIKKTQEDAALLSLRQANLDPGVNLLFGKMREELQQTKDKLEQAQSELSAWKFTPDSQNGKKLISRCRTLIAENQELGRQLSQGKSAQLEAELALQKKYSEELKASQDELNEFVIQLDEEVEGMQSTIQVLQQQLAATKQEAEGYKKMLNQYENMIHSKKENDIKTNLSSKRIKMEKDYHGSSSVNRNRTNNNNEKANEIQNVDKQSVHNLKQLHKTKYSKSISNACGNNNTMPVDTRTDSVEEIEPVSSPGTPTTEMTQKGNNCSPATPTQEHIEYVDDDSDSWSNNGAGDMWDDRTNLKYSDCSSDEAVEDVIENQEISSENSDCANEETDDIKAHISVCPTSNRDIQFDTPDKTSQDLSTNVKKLHHYNESAGSGGQMSVRHTSVTYTDSRSNILKSGVAKINSKSVGTTDIKNISESTIPAVLQHNSLADEAALQNHCKNVPTKQPMISGLQQPYELSAQQNALLATTDASSFTIQRPYGGKQLSNETLPTKASAGQLNNHTISIENGVGEKSE